MSSEVLASILWNVHGYLNEIVSRRLHYASELSAALLTPPRNPSATYTAGVCFVQLRELLLDIAALQSLRLSIDKKCRDLYCKLTPDTVSAERCAEASPALMDVINTVNDHISFLFRWVETLEEVIPRRQTFSDNDEGRGLWSELQKIVELAEDAIHDYEKARALVTADAEMLLSNMLAANERFLELQEEEFQEHKRNVEKISELRMTSRPQNS
jgi:hypothetical protein